MTTPCDVSRPPTRVLFACDTFKGTLPSYRVGEAGELGIRDAVVRCARRGGSAASATTTSSLLCRAVSQATFEVSHCPMSDGGAGLLDSLTYKQRPPPQREEELHRSGSVPPRGEATGLQRVFIPASVPITGPLGTPIAPGGASSPLSSPGSGPAPVSFACSVADRVVVVEMAEASGLPRVPTPSKRNPLRTTSYGTGEVLRYALQHMERELNRRGDRHPPQGGDTGRASAFTGVEVFIGIGGSATNDGGLGALQGLGVLDIFVESEDGEEVKLVKPFCGGDLARITRVAVRPELQTMLFHHPSPEEPTPTSEAPAVSSRSSGAVRTRVFVRRVRLICDVDNPLVGPRGATYTFGPQKCAPKAAAPSLNAKEGSASDGEDEDGAVGVITSQAQHTMLDTLEAGMRHAARCVVASTFAALRALHRSSARAQERMPTEEECLSDLLHGSGGGGAGGMSGFFRYILGATWMAGADAVAELLGLRLPPSSQGADDNTRRGLLYTGCDVLVSGEGSFDVQTISSHKTVGRLLEMAVEANLSFLLSPSAGAVGERRGGIQEFVVVCGRMGFHGERECQDRVHEALAQTLLPSVGSAEGARDAPAEAKPHLTALLEAYVAQHGSAAPSSVQRDSAAAYRAAIAAATPRIIVLPLSPFPFTAKEAMQRPYQCVRRCMMQYCLTGQATQDEDPRSRL